MTGASTEGGPAVGLIARPLAMVARKKRDVRKTAMMTLTTPTPHIFIKMNSQVCTGSKISKCQLWSFLAGEILTKVLGTSIDIKISLFSAGEFLPKSLRTTIDSVNISLFQLERF